MRIVLYVPVFPQLTETFIVNKFCGLLASGHDALIVCDRFRPDNWEKFEVLKSKPGLRQRVIQTSPREPRWRAALSAPATIGRSLLANPSGVLRYLGSAWSAVGLRSLIQLYLDAELVRLKPDIIHFEFGALAVNRTHLKSRLRCGLVTSFRGHDLNFVGLDDPQFYSEVWAQVDAIHLLGSDLWHRAQRRGCPDTIEHALIPPAIDIAVFARDHAPTDESIGTLARPARLLSIARLHWSKGHEYVMQSLRQLIDRGHSVELRIVGEGDFLQAAVFCRHQLGLDGTVTLLGGMTHEALREEMLHADILVHGAVSEGFCNAVLEAQAMMIPVVVTDADGLGENVVDGETGFVVPRRDPHFMTERLARLITDRSLRRRMGQAGRSRVTNNFRLTEQIRSFDQFYRDLYEGLRP